MRTWQVDLAVLAGYLLLGGYLFAHLWVDPSNRFMLSGVQDQTQFEWFLAHGTYAITHLKNPFFTTLLNTPSGANLISNASMLGLAVPLAPVTLLFGPGVSVAVGLTGSLAGTAGAWYWLFSRHVVGSTAAAALGGALCGFAPIMVSHAVGSHLNFTSLFLVPFIIWRVVRLREAGRAVRNGLILGLLVVYQVFLGEEALLITVLGLAVFTLSYAFLRWSVVRAQLGTFLTGLGVAAGVALGLLAYPLYIQFFGPQSYDGLPHMQWGGNDLLSLVSVPTQSLAGLGPTGQKFALNLSEENGFFGWSLLILGLSAGIALWRMSALVRAVTITMGFFLLASLGREITVNGHPTGVPSPWRAFVELPLLDSVMPARLTLVSVPCLAFLLAVATDRVLAVKANRLFRRLWICALAAALVPLLPTPISTSGRLPVPAFFTQGTWRRYVDPGGVVMSARPADGGYTEPMRWQARSGMEFSILDGYIMSPGPDGHGQYSPIPRATARLLTEVAASGTRHVVTPADRAALRNDLGFWNVDVIVLDPRQPSAGALRGTVEDLLGKPGTFVDRVWLWDVRPLTR